MPSNISLLKGNMPLRLKLVLRLTMLWHFRYSPPNPRESRRNKSPTNDWPVFILEAENYWRLATPSDKRFDASGLVLRQPGELWTISDRGPGLYRIEFSANRTSHI